MALIGLNYNLSGHSPVFTEKNILPHKCTYGYYITRQHTCTLTEPSIDFISDY